MCSFEKENHMVDAGFSGGRSKILREIVSPCVYKTRRGQKKTK